jgi:predicted aldo/keto reductase-like oxidoreductase
MPCPAGVNIPGCFSSYNEKSLKQYMMNCGVLVTKKGVASGCVGCGKCEPLCPQSLPIQDALKKVKRKMEPWWFKPAAAVARRIYSGKNRGNNK